MTSKYSLPGCVLGSVLALILSADITQAQNGTIRAANPNIQGGGVGSAATAAKSRGPLSMSDDVALKKAANQALDSERSNQPADARSASEASSSPRISIADRHSFAGLSTEPEDADKPANVTGAIGPTRYIQAVNRNVRIFNRNTNEAIVTGTLDELAGNAASVETFNPQIMWDPTTERFYYVMNSVFSPADNRLSFGFSKTANPATISSADWCQYDYTPSDPSRFPDYPKLGDNRDFTIFGVNSFAGTTFVGSDLIAISKPPAGTACPAPGSFKMGTALDLRDKLGDRVFTPVPSNQIDNNPTGFVVARSRVLPSKKLWFFSVSRNATTGNPVFGPARGLAVAEYSMPPDASQPSSSQRIDTLDARPTQAVQAINPDRGNTHSFYVQHTTGHRSDNRSVIRWYEINPAPQNPVLLRRGEIGARRDFFFNAAISPDRQKNGTRAQFGNSFVIHYNVSSKARGFPARIVAGSSVRGADLKFLRIKLGVRAYQDSTCLPANSICRWSTYSSAAPDPRPTNTGKGEVWNTNQFAGDIDPSTDLSDFRSWIFSVSP